MNWRQVKTILIVLFLLTNIFLIIYSSYSHYVKVNIPPELTQKVVRIAQNAGVSISDELIPSKKTEVERLVLINVTEAEARLAQDIIGETKKSATLGGEMYIDQESGAYLALSGGTAVSCGNIHASGDEYRSAEKFVSRFDTKLASHFLISRNDETCEYVFGQTIDGHVIDDAQLYVKVAGGKISASGTYIYSQVVPSSNSAYSDPHNVILNFIGINEDGTEVSSFELCYVMEKTIGTTSLRAAYKITDEKGQSTYFDAASGDKLK